MAMLSLEFIVVSCPSKPFGCPIAIAAIEILKRNNLYRMKPQQWQDLIFYFTLTGSTIPVSQPPSDVQVSEWSNPDRHGQRKEL